MGFLSTGRPLNTVQYKFEYLTKNIRKRRKIAERLGLPAKRQRLRKKKPKSILERLPLELLYEIYIYSGMSDLNKTSKYFHSRLGFIENRYLIDKFISHNIHRYKLSDQEEGELVIVLATNIVRHDFVKPHHLEPYGVSYFADFQISNTSRGFRLVNGDIHSHELSDPPLEEEIDLPKNLYLPNEQNIALIFYLLNFNFNYLQLDVLVRNVVDLDWLSKPDFEKLVQKYSTFDKLDQKLIDSLILTLRHGNFEIAEWFISKMSTESLRENIPLWNFVHETKSSNLLTFLHSHNITPSLHALL